MLTWILLAALAPPQAQFVGKAKYLNGARMVVTQEKKGRTDRWNEEYFRREGDTLYVTVRPHTMVEFR